MHMHLPAGVQARAGYPAYCGPTAAPRGLDSGDMAERSRRDATDGGGAGTSQAERPRSLIFTVYGAYSREFGGWFAIADLVRLMAELGVDEAAVRSAVSRLKRRGLLSSERRSGVAGYSISEDAREVLRLGDRRIFGRGRASLADGWVLVVFSVPERERHKRHLLRSRLQWLGFGSVDGGNWIAPAHVAEEADESIARLGLSGHVSLFRADYLGGTDLEAMVGRWWDLPALEAMYDQFAGRFGPVLARWAERGGDDAAAFADYVTALNAWRRLPYLDPGLPAELLPEGWSSHRAEEIFSTLQARLREQGLAYVNAIVTR